jgi:hypothetical protein
MKTCPDCGERVYNLGCTNCNEEAYIEEQDMLTELQYPAPLPQPAPAPQKGEQEISDPMTNPTSPGGAGEALAKRLEAEAERLQDAWRDLRLDAASWREASDMTGGPTSVALMRDALENERLAAEKESTAELLREAAALLTEQSRQQEALTPETVAPWVQIRAGSELSELVRLIRSKREPEAYFHSDYEASGLLWRWALKWARHMAAPPQPKEPR